MNDRSRGNSTRTARPTSPASMDSRVVRPRCSSIRWGSDGKASTLHRRQVAAILRGGASLQLFDWIAERKLKVLTGGEYLLADARTAHANMESASPLASWSWSHDRRCRHRLPRVAASAGPSAPASLRTASMSSSKSAPCLARQRRIQSGRYDRDNQLGGGSGPQSILIHCRG